MAAGGCGCGARRAHDPLLLFSYHSSWLPHLPAKFQTARAAVLLFDQLPRNMHRDSARAFASDPLARAIAKGAIARGWHRGLGKHEKQFLFMPLMHSEAIADQRRSLRLFTALGDMAITRFARAHAGMVVRFGRFPHRNAVLLRKSTPAELRAIAAGNHW